LDDGDIRPQPNRVYFAGNAHVAIADALRLLPREQQLHPQFDGLFWLPPGSFHEHHVNGRKRTEPRHGRIPDNSFGLRDVPPDYYLGCRSL
jgi:hypothetical protein